jgi:hypothetical protein
MHPAFPAPSVFEGKIHASLGRIVPREHKNVSTVIASEAIHGAAKKEEWIASR